MKYIFIILLFLITSCHTVEYTVTVTYINGDQEVLTVQSRSDMRPPYLINGCLGAPGYNTELRCGVRKITYTEKDLK